MAVRLRRTRPCCGPREGRSCGLRTGDEHSTNRSFELEGCVDAFFASGTPADTASSELGVYSRTGCDVQTVVPVFTHRAPTARCYRSAAPAVHSLPHFFASRCTRYRRCGHGNASAGVRGDGASPDSLPRAHGATS